MAHLAKKRFGQNFLTSMPIIDQIVAAVNANDTDHLVEIGPGKGAITERLLPACKKLDAIELDRDLLPLLENRFAAKNFQLHASDALKFNFCQLSDTQRLRIVGNLPYNISTPLIFHLLDQKKCIGDMHFMLQKEVVDRLAAISGNKCYGRLSVVTQTYCEVTPLFEIPPDSFDPAPKVMSAFVRLVPRDTPLVSQNDWNQFDQILTAAFAQRRKTLRNNLKKTVHLESLEDAFDLTRRAETFSIEEFIHLSQLAVLKTES